MRAAVILIASCFTLSTLALLFFLSQNPFEFAVPNCDGNTAAWHDVISHGCLDGEYVAEFIVFYGLVLFVPALALLGVARVMNR
jgi:hypothetical protein